MALPAFRMKELPRLYPFVDEIEVRWTEKGEGLPEGGVEKGPFTFSTGNLEGSLRCANPACAKGGFELTNTLKAMIESRQEERQITLECGGYLGSRRRSGPVQTCPNTAEVQVRIVYRGK